MSPGTTFERVYRALKEQLGSGQLRPGEPLEPRAISDALNSSITPVRDALHRLVGERLVEAPRASGFRIPTVTEVALRNLYDWNQRLLLLGLVGPTMDRSIPAPDLKEPVALLWRTEMLFEAIAGRSGNPEHVEAIARLGERLRPIRSIEEGILASIRGELDQLEDEARRDDRAALARSIRLYHRRRQRAAALLVATLMSR